MRRAGCDSRAVALRIAVSDPGVDAPGSNWADAPVKPFEKVTGEGIVAPSDM
jgi:hypothetical protein